jgi:hypothetical protein
VALDTDYDAWLGPWICPSSSPSWMGWRMSPSAAHLRDVAEPDAG